MHGPDSGMYAKFYAYIADWEIYYSIHNYDSGTSAGQHINFDTFKLSQGRSRHAEL